MTTGSPPGAALLADQRRAPRASSLPPRLAAGGPPGAAGGPAVPAAVRASGAGQGAKRWSARLGNTCHDESAGGGYDLQMLASSSC